MSTQNDPLLYLGIKSEAASQVVIGHRVPTTKDIFHNVGDIWINKVTSYGYMLVSLHDGLANWQALVSGSDLTTLVDAQGAHATPIAGEIIFNVAEGITSTAVGNTMTIGIDKAATAISDFYMSPIMQSSLDTGVAPTGATGDVNLMCLQEGEIMEQFIIGAGQTIIAPRMDASGLLVSLDLTATEGAEYNWGMRASAKHATVVGTDPAISFNMTFKVADVSGATPILMGFRKQAANNQDYTQYTDYAAIGLNNGVSAGKVIIEDRLNSGVAVQTDTTDAWADGETHTLEVNVSAAGVVTYAIDNAAPTATHAFTFDAGDTISPFFHFVHGAAAPGAIHWIDMICD